MRSIIVEDLKHCVICGAVKDIEMHHCIHGTSGRKLATKYHLLVGLCPEHHRGTNGVHGKNGAELDLMLKRIAQTSFEQKHSHEKWMEIFGRNYLD